MTMMDLRKRLPKHVACALGATFALAAVALLAGCASKSCLLYTSDAADEN